MIGWVEQTPQGEFAVGVPWGRSLAGWIASGDTTTFAALTDAAAAAGMGFMAHGLDPGRSSGHGRGDG